MGNSKKNQTDANLENNSLCWYCDLPSDLTYGVVCTWCLRSVSRKTNLVWTKAEFDLAMKNFKRHLDDEF